MSLSTSQAGKESIGNKHTQLQLSFTAVLRVWHVFDLGSLRGSAAAVLVFAGAVRQQKQVHD